MFMSSRTRWLNRLNSWLFILLISSLTALLAWLSTNYPLQSDWTRHDRHTLSAASQQLLAQFNDTLTFTVYVTQDEALRSFIRDLLAPYQRASDHVHIEFINPLTVPGQVREQDIQNDGELILHYQGRTEQLRTLSEEVITNGLQRLIRGEYRLIVFLTGHGERSPDRFANHDVTDWADHLRSRGFMVETHHLTEQGELPKEAGLLVLAGVKVPLLPGEWAAIERYLTDGGNLLWLLDPETAGEPKPLQKLLGLQLEPGLLIDPTSQIFGVNDPAIVTISDYSQHPLVQDFPYITLFPEVLGLSADPPPEWSHAPLLYSQPEAWLEQQPQQQPPTFEQGIDYAGPIALALALTRPYQMRLADGQTETVEQRVIVVGDGDFLANAYLGNSGNLDLGLRFVNWLVRDEQFIDIPARTVIDKTLTLTPTQAAFLGLIFLFGLPLSLFGIGVLVNLHRRRF